MNNKRTLVRFTGRANVAFFNIARFLPLALALILLLQLGACSSDPDDEGGVIGTGIILRGTASENKQFAKNEIDARAQSGEYSAGLIAQDGQYTITSVSGEGPWLLRSDLGSDQYRFGIAFDRNVAHVHSYTDATLRNWFLREHSVQNLNALFDSTATDMRFPSEQEFTSNALQLLAYVELAIESYQLGPNQILQDEFRADNTGIDLFLDNNPVVLDSQTIAILLTDPISQTQSVNQAGLMLDQRFDVTDLQIPSTPEAVRALGSSINQIVLVWEPSTDNTAVVGYQIYRDGSLIDTTAYPVYTDDGLQAGTSYQYEIAAIDRSANVSERSVAVLGMPQLSSDNVAPSQPSNLISQLATPSRVELIWLQDNIADVVAFNVYRGDNGVEPSFLLKVSSNGLTDATVSGGTDYCYQVAAVDAAGNLSTLSETLCVLTTGIAIDVPTNNDLNVPPLAGLTIPDTQSLSCTATIDSYLIEQETTIAAGCYQVEQNILVERFGVLTLAPGVVLKFAEGTSLRVSPGGAIEFLGLAANPVVLTGAQPQTGFWNGVYINRSDSRRNKIIHTVIEYAGGGGEPAALTTFSSVGSPLRLQMDNSLIRYSNEYGFDFSGLSTIISSFSGNLITQNARTGAANILDLASLADGSDLRGNDDPRLRIPRLGVTDDIVISDLGVPISINGIDQEAGTIIVNAGAELHFEVGSAFRIAGSVLLAGTSENPILITSSNSVAGDWGGVQVLEGANVEFTNVLIEQAGRVSSDNPLGANLYANNARLSLSNVTLRDSTGYGLQLANDTVIVDKFERITMNNNLVPARISLAHLDALASNPTITGNSDNRVDIQAGAISRNVTWHNIGMDYRLDGVYQFNSGSVVINPGVSIAATAASELRIEGSAMLQAVGTAASPISMTGALAGQGQWAGVTIRSNQANVLDHVLLQRAGGTSIASSNAQLNGAIKVDCSAAVPAQVSLSNMRIEDSGSWGVFVSDNGCSVTLGSGMQYVNNVLGASNR